jgi:hypothetical protein
MIIARSTIFIISTLKFSGYYTNATISLYNSFIILFKVKLYSTLLGIFLIAIDSELFK